MAVELVDPTSGSSHVVSVPVELLYPASDNPRHAKDDIDELAQSIRSVGILQPLVIVPKSSSGFSIVCGERRWRAAAKIGLRSVPCLIRAFDDRERQEAMLIENLQRQTLRPLEEAEAYRRLMKLGYTQLKIAQRVGRSQGHVSRRLSLLSLPSNVQWQVNRRELRVDRALGYEAAPASDIFEADSQLQAAWSALRREVIDMGDRQLIRLLTDFARAYVRRMKLGDKGPTAKKHAPEMQSLNPGRRQTDMLGRDRARGRRRGRGRATGLLPGRAG